MKSVKVVVIRWPSGPNKRKRHKLGVKKKLIFELWFQKEIAENIDIMRL